CNLYTNFKGQRSIPVFPTKPSAAMEIYNPSFCRRRKRFCQITVEIGKSFYLDRKGWKKIALNSGFPFYVARKKRKFHLKWSSLPQSSKLHGKVIRLGIQVCQGYICQIDCLLFKVAGRTVHQCKYIGTIPQPTTTITIAPSWPVTVVTQRSTRPSRQVTMPSQEPSVSDKNKRGSSTDDSGGTPWAITGAIIGVVAVLILCVIVLVLWFCRWKKKFKNKKNNSAASSGFVLNPSEAATEVTYASPHHSYQELKPPIRGAAPGAYQSLQWKAKEDPSGYMLPSPSVVGVTSEDPEPLYNEIGSPPCRSPPMYDYALPEDTVRFSAHSLSDNALNQIDNVYIGRPTRDHEGSQGTYSTGAEPSIQNGDLNSPVESGYLDFLSERNAYQTNPVSNSIHVYEDPRSSAPREHNQEGTTSTGPSQRGSYQAMIPPTNPRYEPLRLSRENLQNGTTTA
ncbi:hypothetical protein QZH41_014021, partial [Actinostola sp. cb2023]